MSDGGDPFRGLVEAAPDGIVISRNGIVVYVNPAAVRLLGYEREEDLVGASMSVFLDAAEGMKMRRRLEEMRVTGRVLPPCEYGATRRDGTKIVAEITSMFTVHDGAPAVVAFARDVTERASLRAQLAHADRLASLGMLAAGVAHEINNPLAFMTLAAELLARKLAGTDTGEHVQGGVRDILAGASRIARIVHDLKAYARMEDEAPGPVDVAQVVEAAERIVAHEIRPRARLRLEVGELPAVHAVETRLEQVIVNLLLNAAHAIPDEKADGEIVIRGEAGARSVTIDVVDNGGGIAPDLLERIFQPFFTTKPVGTGTGLGLSICRDIVGRFGGDLVALSEPGKGTTMRVTLPLAKESPHAAATLGAVTVPSSRRSRDLPATNPTSPTSPRVTAPRRRVLVIDDEPLIVAMILQALSPHHDVVGETDPHAGLARILASTTAPSTSAPGYAPSSSAPASSATSSKAPGSSTPSSDAPFDIVLCDLMMPGLTGMDLHARIAQERPGLEHKLVFISGGAYTARARTFLDTIPNPRLMKPFSAAELERHLAALP